VGRVRVFGRVCTGLGFCCFFFGKGFGELGGYFLFFILLLFFGGGFS